MAGDLESDFMPCCGQIIKQAVNGSGAVVRYAGAKLAGQETRCTPEQIAARMAVCMKCEFMSVSKDGTARFCNKCNCWMDGLMLHKAFLTTEDCPENKWPKL
jgi:hypothetical protein